MRFRVPSKNIGSKILLTIITTLAVFPFLWIVMLSFKTDVQILTEPFALPKSINFENYARALRTLDLSTMFGNTIIISIAALAISLVFSFMSSYCISRMHFGKKRGNTALYLLFISGLTIPPYILIFPIYRITIALNLTNTRLALILPLAATTLALDTLLFVGSLRDFPTEIEEAAIIDGCNLFQLCIRVVLPIIKPVVMTIVIFNVIHFINEYAISSVLINKPEMYTLSLATSMFKSKYGMDFSGLIAATNLIVLPEIIFYALFQKYIAGGMTAGAVKG